MKHNTSFNIDPYFLQSMDRMISRKEFDNRSEIVRYAVKSLCYEREKLIQIQAEVDEIRREVLDV